MPSHNRSIPKVTAALPLDAPSRSASGGDGAHLQLPGTAVPGAKQRLAGPCITLPRGSTLGQGILNDTRRDEDQQFLFFFTLQIATEQATDERQIAEEGGLVRLAVGTGLEDAA